MICDHVINCPDKSDESHALCDEFAVIKTANIKEKCSVDKEFECGGKVCIPKSFVCDGMEHCLDGRDEDVEMCKSKNLTHLGFKCASGEYLRSKSSACDGVKHCQDGSDEGERCQHQPQPSEIICSNSFKFNNETKTCDVRKI